MSEYLTRTDNFIASLGLEAYRVGGSVRDEILGRRVKDADYMVRGATLDSLFHAVASAGGGATLIRDRQRRPLGVRASARGLGLIEITLPREEISTGPAHTDFDIVLDPELSLAEDALRRDFTFNALYRQITPDGPGVVADPTSTGLYDLQHKLVRTTHEHSFRDDPLRILRALRFVSTLGYDLTEVTRWQMDAYAEAVNGLTEGGNTSGTVLEAPLRVRWALLFHDAGKVKAAWIGPDGRKHYYASKVFDLDNGGEQRTTEDHEVISERLWRTAAKRMNVPTRLREDVATLVRNHMVAVSGKIKSSKVRRERVRLGDELLRDLHMHRMCDLSGKTRAHRGHLVHVARLEDVRRQAQALGVPASVKDLKVTGKDAIALGMTGRWIGGALDVLLDEVVVQPDDLRLSREWQLSRLEHMANHRKDLDAIIECR
jgi:hypothetical protein